MTEGAAVGRAALAASYRPADTSRTVQASTVGGVLAAAAVDAADVTALVDGGPDRAGRRRWTFRQLYDDASRVAAALLRRFSPGERVAVWAPNLPEWVLLEYGTALAGITLVTVNPAYKPGELRHVLGQSRAAGVFLVSEHRGNPLAASLQEVRTDLPHLREVIALEAWEEFLASGDGAVIELPAVAPDAAAQIQYTSGTTGFPKGVLLHHRGVTNNGRFIAERLDLRRGEVLLTPMPLFHTAGCVVAVLSALQSRAAVCPLHTFDPGLMLQLLEETRATVTGGVPTMVQRLMDHPEFASRDLSAVRTVILGATAIAPQLVRQVEAAFAAKVTVAFGQTEASAVISMTERDDSPEDKAHSLGRPLSQVDVKIAGPGGSPVPIGAVGEICARGYQVMSGYFEMPEATSEAIDDDGWLHTGDLGSMDDRGYLYIRGRLKDMIIRGGENIFPAEIEHVLNEHPEVADAAVVGIPDTQWGEVVVAFVQRTAGSSVTEDQLRSHVRGRLAPFKTPQSVVFVETFPLTPSGKVQKFVLRDKLVASLPCPA
jgi:fatty-acyl-CoA synthase